MKRTLSILLALLLVFSLTACSLGKKIPAGQPEPEPAGTADPVPVETADNGKVFSCEEMRITLTDDFAEEDIDAYTGVFESSNSAVFVLREDKSLLPGVDFDNYVELVAEANQNAGREIGDIHRKDGIPLFEYDFTNDSTGQTFRYYTTIFESEDAFWLVQFTSFASDYKDLVDQFHKYARSVTFDD